MASDFTDLGTVSNLYRLISFTKLSAVWSDDTAAFQRIIDSINSDQKAAFVYRVYELSLIHI